MVLAQRWRMVAGAILLLWLLPARAGEPPQAAPATATVLPIVADDDGVPVIEIYLNGGGPFRASIDTGARGVEIDSDLAKQLGLQATQRSVFSGLAGPAQGLSGGAKVSISFGPVNAAGISTMISAADPASARFRKQIHANIGANLLKGFALTIDLPSRKIVLTPSDDYTAPEASLLLPMEEGSSLELIPASVDGERGWYCIDSGASYGVWFAQDYIRDRDLTARFQWPARVGHMTVFGATRALDLQSRYALRLGSALFLEPRVTLPEYLPAGDTTMPDAGCIGMRVLKYFRFTLDKSRKQLVIEPASSEPRIFAGPGIDLSVVSGRTLIRSVVAGGPAHVAGLKPGDELLSLAGKAGAEVFRYLDGAAWFAGAKQNRVPVEVRRDGRVVRAELAVHTWSSPALLPANAGAPGCTEAPCSDAAPPQQGSPISRSNYRPGSMFATYTSALYNKLLPETDRAMTLVARGFEGLKDDEARCCRIAFGHSLRDDRYALLDHSACEAAILDFDAAQRVDAGDRYSYIGRAQCLVRLGRYDEALANYDTALTMDANAPSALAGRGWANRFAGRQAEALADFDTALALHDLAATTRKGRAEALFLQGQFGAAATAYDEYLRLAPGDIYGAIWRYLALKKGGAAAAEIALAIDAGASTKDRWRHQFLRLYKGELAPAGLMAEASSVDPRLARDRQCEANFYIGEYFLTKSDQSTAKEYFARAATDCDPLRVERPDAAFELQRLVSGK